MVPYAGRPIIEYILDALRKVGISEIVVITGFCPDVLFDHLEDSGIRFRHNPDYDRCNMVKTLFCAREEMDADLIVSYGDIVYGADVLRPLVDCREDLAVTYDVNWRSLWQQRMDCPLDDAETFKLDADGFVAELGKKTADYADIHGQYMGLIKFSRRIIQRIADVYNAMDRRKTYDGKDYDNMYMTSFLQELIDRGIRCKGVPITGQWREIDSPSDLLLPW